MRTISNCFALSILVLGVAWECGAASHDGTVKTGGTNELFVTNSLGDDITVIDLDTFKVIRDIKVGAGVHGLCAPADGRRIFTTVESEHNLKSIDTASGRILSTIPLSGRPNQCAATPDGRFVAVPIRDGNSVEIVDMTLNRVVKTLPIKIPHNCFNAGSNTSLFVSSMGSDEVDLIDLKKMDYAEKIPVGGVPRPYAVSNDQKTMYVALSDFHGFAIVSIPERKVVRRVELPSAPPSKCVLEPHTPTHGLALSPDGRELWVTSLGDNGVYVYSVATKKISRKIAVGSCPNLIALSPDGRYCAVSNSGSDDCSIIDTRTEREAARIKAGHGPKRVLAVRVPAP
ncbi:MAG: beta-propeller fold lactonase family protein [Bryobacteraceae bacterium]